MSDLPNRTRFLDVVYDDDREERLELSRSVGDAVSVKLVYVHMAAWFMNRRLTPICPVPLDDGTTVLVDLRHVVCVCGIEPFFDVRRREVRT